MDALTITVGVFSHLFIAAIVLSSVNQSPFERFYDSAIICFFTSVFGAIYFWVKVVLS